MDPEFIIGEYKYREIDYLRPKVYVVRRTRCDEEIVVNSSIQKDPLTRSGRPRCRLTWCFNFLKRSIKSKKGSTGSIEPSIEPERSINYTDCICKVEFVDVEKTPTEIHVPSCVLREPHPRITRVEGLYRNGSIPTLNRPIPDPRVAHMVFEYCELGDLWHLAEKYKNAGKTPPEGFIWHVLLQLSEALAFLHFGHGSINAGHKEWTPVFHRDIKPDNVFLKADPAGNVDEYPNVKLGDFGVAIASDDPEYNPLHRYGTNLYQPPELERSSAKSDVWGLGATIYSLCRLRETPVNKFSPGDWDGSEEEWLASPAARQPRLISPPYSTELQTWIDRLLDPNPETRISSKTLAEEMARTAPALRERYFEPLIDISGNAYWDYVRSGEFV
jgi:serine/threonine protein kinase